MARRDDRSDGRKRDDRPELPDYSVLDPKDIPDGPDVLLDVPVVKVDKIEIEVDDLRAQVAVMAEVRDLVQLSVGADAGLGKVELRLEGIEAQALLKARLDNVGRILERVLLSLDRNPELLESIGKAVEDVGRGGGELVSDTGEVVEDVGEGAGEAVEDVGEGAGQAVGEVGKGAREGVAEIGQGAEKGVSDVGKGAGRGVSGVGKGAQQATEGLAKGGKPSSGGRGKPQRRRRGGG